MYYLITVLVAVSAVNFCFSEQYTDKYDNVDIDEILQSDRLLMNYHKCLMDKGPCTPDGRDLKQILPDALETECSKCSEKQKSGARKVMHYLIVNKRDLWNELEGKYDPEKKYIERYKDDLEKEGIVL